MSDLSGVLWVMAALAAVALITATVVVVNEINAAKSLYDSVGRAAAAATTKIGEILDRNEADDRLVAARLTGATEYLHTLPTLGEVRRPSGLPSAALVLVGLLVVAGTTLAAVDRVEHRRERVVCLEALAGAPTQQTAGKSTTTTAVGAAAPTGTPTTTTTAVGAKAPPGTPKTTTTAVATPIDVDAVDRCFDDDDDVDDEEGEPSGRRTTTTPPA